MTKREFFETIATIATEMNRTDLVEHCEHEIELLNKKHSGERKPTATQVANTEIKIAMLEHLITSGAMMRATDFQTLDFCKGLTVQRITALLTQLSGGTKATGNEPVIRLVEKKIAYYKAR